jgi:DNA-directed RNA polymerase specialized sigma24 family protein
MTRVDEFNNFYSSTSATALKATYAVCGDRQVAFDATVDAYRRAWRDWTKIRNHHPLGWVRNEAWKLTALSRSTHPLRRKHEEDADVALLEALGELPVDNRRLIVLLTLGQTDLEDASREVGIPAQQGIETVTSSLGELEQRLGQSLSEIEERMHGLGSVTRKLEMPASDTIRRRAQAGRRRNTILLVAAALALVLGGGMVVTEGGALETSAALPDREKIGSEGPDLVLQAQKIGTDDLLSMSQVHRLDPAGAWKIVGTDDNTQSTTPYATCPTKRFANKDPLRAFVRTYEVEGRADERVAQAIEVSRSPEQAEEAYQRLVGWYSDCEHPRVQLVGSYLVKREFGDFRILVLHSHRSPERTFTVGFSHSGTVTSTLVHEVDGDTGPDVNEFALTLNDSVARVCQESGGRCTNDDVNVVRTAPPPTTEAPEFLGIVDLPPIADIDKVWAGVEPFRPKVNPAATQCDAANFRGKSVQETQSRIFVIPGTRALPEAFGVAETVGRFGSDKDAKAFVKAVEKRIAKCPDANLSAEVDQKKSITSGDDSGTAWRVGLEVNKKSRVYYRMAIVRRGADVAQMTFTPAGTYDISQNEFVALATRSAQRLIYLQ